MTIKELIEKLKEYPEDTLVIQYDSREESIDTIKSIHKIKLRPVPEKDIPYLGEYKGDSKGGIDGIIFETY